MGGGGRPQVSCEHLGNGSGSTPVFGKGGGDPEHPRIHRSDPFLLRFEELEEMNCTHDAGPRRVKAGSPAQIQETNYAQHAGAPAIEVGSPLQTAEMQVDAQLEQHSRLGQRCCDQAAVLDYDEHRVAASQNLRPAVRLYLQTVVARYAAN